MIEIRRLFKSFRYALHGIRVVFRDEQSFRLQAIAGLAVVASALVLHVRTTEFILLVLLIGAVLTLELVNSVFERIVDGFKPRLHPVVGDIKDIMAATVLIASLVAAVVGLVIFVPRLSTLF
ncbi:diacylglycerol kinase family protein [Patescibacteria group bacterium]|nr:MAG: diacylglycerol kinase family protein [Patescibacteria group bacterium]